MCNDRGFYFSNIFDWVMTQNRIIKNISPPRHIYIKLDFLPKYFNLINTLENPFILISGCSDMSPQIHYKEYYDKLIQNENLDKWYMENNHSNHPKTRSLSVGFATHSEKFENDLLNIRKSVNINNKKERIFCCWRNRDENCCGNEFYERNESLELFVNKNELCDVYQPNLSAYEYQKKLSEYKWCLCPLGNGMDHAPKLLECLFLKTIAICKKNANSMSLYSDYPIIWVDNWDDINNDVLKYHDADWDKIVDDFRYKNWFKKITSTELQQSSTKTHFITYGNENFKNSKVRICKEANLFGVFDSIRSYGPEDLDQSFVEKFKDVLKLKRGSGYWIWKWNIIEKKMKEIDDGDFLVYLDAGSTVNYNGKQRFMDYLKLLENSEYGFLSFQLPHSEKKWTTKQIFDYFDIDIDSEIAISGQLLATVLIIKKNLHSVKIISECLKCIEYDQLLVTDYYSKQESYFEENRHDQSILSVVRKIHGSLVISEDETYIVPFGGKESMKYPFWATRIRG